MLEAVLKPAASTLYFLRLLLEVGTSVGVNLCAQGDDGDLWGLPSHDGSSGFYVAT